MITFSEREFNDRPLPVMYDSTEQVAILVLDARGLDFLIEELPHDDGMTRDLITLREKAKESLWARLSG